MPLQPQERKRDGRRIERPLQQIKDQKGQGMGLIQPWRISQQESHWKKAAMNPK